MRRHQSIPQRKALKQQNFVDPITAVRRSLYAQARSEIAPRYQLPRIGLVLILLALWLTISQFTSFRWHMSTWLVTGVFPNTDWQPITFYVVSFLFSLFAFVWVSGWIDRRQEIEIDLHYAELKVAYANQHGVILEK